MVISHGHIDHYAQIGLFGDVPTNVDQFVARDSTLLFNGIQQGDRVFINGDTNLEIIQVLIIIFCWLFRSEKGESV